MVGSRVDRFGLTKKIQLSNMATYVERMDLVSVGMHVALELWFEKFQVAEATLVLGIIVSLFSIRVEDNLADPGTVRLVSETKYGGGYHFGGI